MFMDNGNANETPKFEHWCIVELFGHQRMAGFVTEATIGGCALLRVDVPKTDNPEETSFTRYLGNGAIYALNPTTKEQVLAAVKVLYPPPPVPREMPAKTALPEARDYNYDDEDED